MSIALKSLSTWLTPTGFIQPDTPALRKQYVKLREAIEQELKAEENRMASSELNLSTEA
jgi:hypothetical protein